MNTKTCRRCETEKPELEFSLRNGKPRSNCKVCAVQVEIERKQRNPEKYEALKAKMRLEWSTDPAKKYHRMAIKWAAKYKMPYNEAIKFLVYDKWHPCPLCDRKPIEGLVVDHCHDKGHVRGYVCGECNSAIGYLRNKSEVARKIATYLEKC